MKSVKVSGGKSSGGLWRAACVVALTATACLATGFMAGKVYMDGVNGNSSSSMPALTTGLAASSSTIPGPVCFNTCTRARDGVCDEGRYNVSGPLSMMTEATAHQAYCDLGTDCEDCGAWEPTAAPSWHEEKREGPVALLQSRGVEIRVKSTVFELDSKPAFFFAYTDPAKDLDVSANMENRRAVEYGITHVFYRIFKDGCVKADGSRSLFLDVGSNFGWFTVLAARMGCRVIAYEPVPQFRAFLEYNVHLNGLEHLVEVRKNVVSHEHGVDMTMVVPSGGIWGTAGINGDNIDRAASKNVEEIKVASVSLDKTVSQPALLMKVDVEGWEWSVMQGAEKLLRNRAVENIIMEYSPGVPERHFNFLHMKLTVEMLMALIKHGFRIGHIGDMNKHEGSDWDSQLGSLEEVTLGNLVYDRHDVDLWEKDTLGCPLDESLLMFQGWGRFGCGRSLPEDVSPFSLRSMIGHNTNLWASTSDHLLPLGGTVGIIDLGQDLKNDFFVPDSQPAGMGSRICKDLPAMVQVRHRCHCSHEECQAEEAAVAAVSAAGRMAANYQLPSPEKDPRSVKMTCKCVGAECTC
uniref:Methyltransferase FkbM domain-containing protein n=1 Tax=Chlamydomonas euryale TaxID=1486919 RepID=A0A7R9VX54_9CHLO|mmetsp:Transcript_6003/g.18536  ORF Transcript_6003/g.18536 Transcript_6003/m.18536 type:complete len:578 (+) Transcript_6003:272-2005(+)